MTFYQCFFIMFLNKCIGKISIIYYVLSHWIHSISRQMHCNWGNLYHLLCAFSFYFLTKSIFFENTITSSTRSYWGNPYHLLCASPFYFLTSSIFFENTVTDSIRSYWENPYHLLCASPSGSFYSPAGALPLGKPLLFTMCFPILFLDGLDFLWKHGYGLNPLLLGKPLPFTMCFPILFPGGRTGETPIIYYVLLHRVHPIPRRAHCHWGNPYYLLCASPSYSSAGSIFFENTHGPNPLLLGKPLSFTMCFPIGSGSPTGALPLGKPLLFTMCFSILFSGGLDFLWKHAWAQPALTGETPIIYYVLPHSIPRRAHWGNPYHLLCASPSGSSYSPAGALGTPLLFTMCFPIGSCSSASALPLGKPLLFSGCFPSYRCSRLGTDPDHGRCQAIPRDIGETSII